jgi:hypothetical protein
MLSLKLGPWVVFSAAMLCTSPVLGQAPEEAPPPAPNTEHEESLLRAKSLFRQGVAVYEAGDVARAVDYFRRSREEYPSARNTVNEALCLDKLGRYDEALELYEQAIARHAAEMDEEDRTATAAAMTALRAKVGELEIASNVKGDVLVGSRPRGRLPFSTPLRVLPGRHVVRVIQSGYMPFEAVVEVVAAQSRVLDAKLSPLEAAGGLRVEDTSESGVVVLVDGAEMGAAPWEGMLAPGVHVVQARGEGRVSMPARVMVVQGQTVLSRLRSEPVAAQVTIRAVPATAEIVLEGVPLGKGSWEGALPAGDHRVRVHEEGYFSGERTLALGAASEDQEVEVRLRMDPEHPRWPRPPKGKLWVSPWLGGALGPALQSGAEQGCPSSCPKSPPVWGFVAGLRMGYELPFPLSFELTAGFLSVQRRITREASSTFPAGASEATVRYELDDIIRLRGPLFGGGASYGFGPYEGVSLRTRLTVGLVLASSYDVIEGEATANGTRQDVNVDGSGGAVTSRPVFVMPEIGAETKVGGWNLGGALGVMFLPKEGPDSAHESLSVSREGCDLDNPGNVACAPAYGGVAGERAYGPLFLFVPQISATYVF